MPDEDEGATPEREEPSQTPKSSEPQPADAEPSRPRSEASGEDTSAGAGRSSSEEPVEEGASETATMLPVGGAVTVRLETVANILTAAVAIAAILLSVWEGVENRRHNRLSVLPHLEPREVTIASDTPIANENFLLPGEMDSLYAAAYALENTGLGPAVVQNIRVFRDGEETFNAADADERYYPGQIKQDLEELPFPTSELQTAYSVGQMLKAGETHPLITIVVPYGVVEPDSLEQWPLGMVLDKVAERSVVVCYCSVYEEDCDQTHFGADPPATDVCEF